MDIQTFGTYVLVGVSVVTIIKGVLEIINIIKAWAKSENKQSSSSTEKIPFSFWKKINALVLAIGIVIMLGGIAWLSYNNSMHDKARSEYFKLKDPQLQYDFAFSQKFETYFKEKFVQPPLSLIGVSFILLSLTFFAGSISKPVTSTLQATSLFTLEIVGLLIGIWLAISNH